MPNNNSQFFGPLPAWCWLLWHSFLVSDDDDSRSQSFSFTLSSQLRSHSCHFQKKKKKHTLNSETVLLFKTLIFAILSLSLSLISFSTLTLFFSFSLYRSLSITQSLCHTKPSRLSSAVSLSCCCWLSNSMCFDVCRYIYMFRFFCFYLSSNSSKLLLRWLFCCLVLLSL